MENKNNYATEKITDFFRKSIDFYGKEIALPSNQHFGIDQICNKENEQQGIYSYHTQYGFPSSGCVSINFSYSEENDTFSITGITVYAPPADKEMTTATFAPQAQVDEITISATFGIDMGTEEHTSIQAIADNPNALMMLDIAMDDLNQAEILGECRVAVPVESNIIPCCNSTRKPKHKGKTV